MSDVPSTAATAAAAMVPTIRPARDADADDAIVIVARCFGQFPGCYLDLADTDADLLSFASTARDQGGQAWAAEFAGTVVGIAKAIPLDGDEWEIGRVYVRPDRQGLGLGRNLVKWIEADVMRRSARRLVLWSDTRFEPAHRFYAALGFQQLPGTRSLNDPSGSIEYHFAKDLP